MFVFFFFFFNDTATTEIYTLSLHDALPIYNSWALFGQSTYALNDRWDITDRKSTRLNSSHITISYAVFCLKKKKKTIIYYQRERYQVNNPGIDPDITTT